MRENYLQKLMLGFFLVIGFTTMSFAQLSEGGTPKSFGLTNDKSNIDKITLSAPDIDQLKAEDGFYEKNGIAERCGISISVGVTPENAGTWTELSNGDRIWRLEITSKGAEAIGLYYDEFEIPKNGKLFIYSADHSQVIGAFTNKNNPKHINFATEALYGDDIIIEYNEIATSNGSKKISYNTNFKLEISNIAYFYKGFTNYSNTDKGFGDSESCEVNINCSPVGDNWQDEKRGVARIIMKDGGSYFWCSGSLINNTSQDCTPYFLTAYHCAATASASDHNQWVFYFNYEASGCSNPSSEPSSNSITGCTVKTTSNIDGGSDLQLLELNSTPSESWNPFYNGWNRSTTASTSGAGIHHPAGDIKKISTYSTSLQTSSPNIGGSQMQSNSAWQVTWSSNDNGWGVTEGGSSGSPLFNASGLIVGTLSGGSSYCTDQTAPDFYGKFDKHWTNGNLASYLDPTGTGATSVPGTNVPCGGVNADFTGSPTTVTVGNTVTFTDNSTGTITSRSWSFPGGTPSSSTAANPTITYNTLGTYNVTLTINGGEDSETKSNYINVIDAGSSSLFTLDFEACTDFDISFDPWTVNDVDATVTYGIDDGSGGTVNFLHSGEAMAFIAFNPNSCSPVQTDPAPHGGDRFGACFSSIPSEGTTNNDWLISPKVQLGTSSSFKLWVKTHTDQWGAERYKIGVSTTTNDPGAFTIISSGTYEEAPNTWTEKTYSLASYDNQEVYVAINCVSEDAFIFMVDDIEILTTISGVKNINNNSVKLYPNPTTGIVNIEGIDNYKELQVLDIQGKTVMTINDFTNTLNVSNLPKGNYIIRIISDNSVITKKLTLIK